MVIPYVTRVIRCVHPPEYHQCRYIRLWTVMSGQSFVQRWFINFKFLCFVHCATCTVVRLWPSREPWRIMPLSRLPWVHRSKLNISFHANWWTFSTPIGGHFQRQLVLRRGHDYRGYIEIWILHFDSLRCISPRLWHFVFDLPPSPVRHDGCGQWVTLMGEHISYLYHPGDTTYDFGWHESEICSPTGIPPWVIKEWSGLFTIGALTAWRFTWRMVIYLMGMDLCPWVNAISRSSPDLCLSVQIISHGRTGQSHQRHPYRVTKPWNGCDVKKPNKWKNEMYHNRTQFYFKLILQFHWSSDPNLCSSLTLTCSRIQSSMPNSAKSWYRNTGFLVK